MPIAPLLARPPLGSNEQAEVSNSFDTHADLDECDDVPVSCVDDVDLDTVVVLRYYLQLSDPEIAHTLGMAVGTIKSTLHRARAQMKEELS